MEGDRQLESGTRAPVKPAAVRGMLAGHVAPFALWIGAILLTQCLAAFGDLPRLWHPWCYAIKTALCAGLLVWFKPWRYYPAPRLRCVALAIAVGLAVAILWILPETPWLGRAAPTLQEFYHRWLIMAPGTLPDYFNPAFTPPLPPGHISLAYSPAEAGWGLTLVKLVGSACVIAVIEEFFFRGFLYRWLRKSRFWEVPLTAFDIQAFWTVAVVFALEHDRWFAGLLAGVAYGWLAVRRDGVGSAAIAHVTTNLVLGIYVIVSRQYGFW